MSNKFYDKNCLIFRIKLELILISLVIYNFLFVIVHRNYNERKDIKIALCTMGKRENLYVKEFIEYYFKLGINHIFIYDDNEPYTEKINKVIDKNYLQNVTIYETKKFKINNQSDAFTQCYNNNFNKFDWFLMVDMDEFLYILFPLYFSHPLK